MTLRLVTNPCMDPANLPSDVRQSGYGAEVSGLVPVYARHAVPSSTSEAEHKLNPKRLLWMAYDKLLAQLMANEDELIDGFRYSRVCFLGDLTLAR